MTKFRFPLDKPAYFEQALFLYKKYSKFLDDDYAPKPNYQSFLGLIAATYPYFFVITEGDYVSGLVYLDNITGNDEESHSAELVTCFDKKYWGDYTKQCAKVFLDACFKKYDLKKIKALVYPDNFRVKTLLKSAGFEKEGLLKKETLRNGKLQDIEVYAVNAEDYYLNAK